MNPQTHAQIVAWARARRKKRKHAGALDDRDTGPQAAHDDRLARYREQARRTYPDAGDQIYRSTGEPLASPLAIALERKEEHETKTPAERPEDAAKAHRPGTGLADWRSAK